MSIYQLIRIFIVVILLFSCNKNKENSTVEILYLANINGNIEACHCGEIMLGGLQNTAAIIDSFRTENPAIIVIDGGDTFNYYSFSELNTAIANSYNIIKPNLWVIGEQDFVEGFPFLHKNFSSSHIELLAGNYELEGLKTIPVKEYSITDIDISITSYLQPGLMQNDQYTNAPNQLNTLLNSLDNSVYNILVMHSDSDEYSKHREVFSKFDLILTAHQQGANIDIDSKPVIIDGFSDGENLINIKINRSQNIFSVKAEIIPVIINKYPNKEIEKLISEYKKTLRKRE